MGRNSTWPTFSDVRDMFRCVDVVLTLARSASAWPGADGRRGLAAFPRG